MNLARIVQDTAMKLVSATLEHPAATEVVHRAGGVRDLALTVQEAVLGALNLPTATDVSRLDTRLRSASQRLHGIEDSLDTLTSRVATVPAVLHRIDQRVDAMSAQTDTAGERS